MTKTQVYGATFWALANKMANYGLSLLTFIVLARLIDVADFGAYAAAFLFVHFCDHVAGFGIADGIVQSEKLSEDQFGSAMWVALGLGAAFALGGVFGGLGLHHLRGVEGESVPFLLAFASLVLFFTPASKCYEARYRREFNIRGIANREIVSRVCAAIVGVLMAVNGFGVWSLLCQSLCAVVVKFSIYFFESRGCLSVNFDYAFIRRLFAFGLPLMLSKVLGFISNRGVHFILAVCVDMFALGIYSTAQKVLTLVNQMFAVVSNQVLFPAISRVQSDGGKLMEYAVRSISIGLIISVPVFMSLSACSSWLVVVVFGGKWAGSGELLMILSFMGISSVQNKIWDTALVSCGMTRVRFWIQLANGIIMIVSVLSVVSVGVWAVCIVHVVRSYLFLLISLCVCFCVLPIRGVQIVRLYIRSLLFALPLVAVWCFNFTLSCESGNRYVFVIVGLLLASILYVVAMGGRRIASSLALLRV